MSDDWNLCDLGGCVEVLDHLRVPVSSDERALRGGPVPYYGANGLQGWIDRKLFDEPLVLMAEDGGNFDDFASRPIAYRIVGPSWVNNHAHVLRATAGVDQSFLFWSLVQRDVRRYIAGGTRSKLTQAELRSIQIDLPPLREQQRIAEILDTLDEAIRKTEEVIAKLQQVKQGLLHDLLTRGIDDHGELRDPDRHPEQFKDSELGRVPRDWAVRCLADVADVRSGIAKNSGRVLANSVQVHYLRVANVQDGYLDLREMSTIAVPRSQLERYRVLPGDVLMNEGGDLDKLGRGALWRGELAECVHQNHVFVVRPRPELDARFLDAWTGGWSARRYFLIAGKQTTNLASINKTSLGGLPMPVPGLPEQARIIAVLEQHAVRDASARHELAKYRTLRSGVMDDLLTGRVRTT
jgi:type I restriction enzyme S subunit